MSWHPILTGELAASANRVLDDVCAALADHGQPAPGLALLFDTMARVRQDEVSAQRAEQALGGLARALENGFESLDVISGLTNAAWVAARITDDLEDVLLEIDNAVVEAVAPDAGWAGPYDLVDGLAGLGTYLLSRPDTMRVRQGLAHIVAYFARSAHERPPGVAWPTPRTDRHIPADHYDCGLAHGAAGVVALLARVAARPDSPPDAARLRDAAARWLIAQRSASGVFPAYIAGDRRPSARAAWCYGAPGIAAALWQVIPDADIAALNRSWLTLTSAEAQVEDAGFCHGATGLAHLANRFFQATGDEAYRNAAVRWFERALDYYHAGTGLGGFIMHQTPPGRAPRQIVLPDFVDGTLGVGLALVAAVAPEEPAWDTLLLCDLPIRNGPSD